MKDFINELVESQISDNVIQGERIKQARLYRGMSQTELADYLGVTKQAISKYESNKMKLSNNIVVKLPKILGFPLSFYMKKNYINKKNNSMIFFRTKEIPKKTKEQLKQKIYLLDSEIIGYLDKYLEFPQMNIPDFSGVLESGKCNYKREDIKKICKMLRIHWSLGNEPIDNLSYILQKNGFIISKEYIDQNKTDGFSQLVEGKAYIFVSANKECAVRTRFDLAHELGHLIMHTDVDEEEQGGASIEREADYFASEFLYPSSCFINEVKNLPLNFETFILLKEKWKISIQAIIRKCKDLELISEEKYIYFQKRISFNKWRFKEPLDDCIIPEEPRLINDAVELLIEHNIISKKDILNNISLSKADILELTDIKKTFFDETFHNVIKLF